MNIDILKFGGTSMNDHQTWKKVLEIIKKYEFPIVIVSATARTTRRLIESGRLAAEGNISVSNKIVEEIKSRHIKIIDDFLSHNPHAKNQLIQTSCMKKIDSVIGKLEKLLIYTHRQNKLSPQLKDAIASLGEQLSSYLLAQCGLALDMPTQHIEARKIIKTDAEYGNANPDMMLTTQKCGSLETVMENGFIPVTGGFYGEAPDGSITTLGFEGSDYTAGVIGNAVNANKIEIWTDVSGIYTSDPNFIEDARPIPTLSYKDATEMAFYGAKVLHPATLKPAQEKNIPVWVKNIFKPDEAGTFIHQEAENKQDVLALSFKKDMVVMTISAYETLMGASFLSRVFTILNRHHLEIDAIQSTEASVTIVLEDSDQVDEFSQEFIEMGTVTLEKQKGIISVIGCTLSTFSKLSEKILNAAGDLSVDLISFSKEKRLLSMVVDEDHLMDTARKIHGSLFE